MGLCAPSSSHEAIEEKDEANDRATYDDAPNTDDKDYEFENYEDYVSSLPMGEEPISKNEFYKGHK